MIKSNGGIIGPDNVTTGGPFGTASGVFKLGEVTDLIKDSKWPTAGPQGYQVDNSCRFDSNNSDYLNRTPGSASNRKTFTFSFWVKRTKLSTNDTIYNVRPDSSGANRISFHSTTNTFRIALEPISKYLFTNRKFTDTSAWYNMVVAFDTTQATASNRIRLYVNGVEETSFGTSDYPNQDTDLDINTTNVINLGRDLETSSDFIDMYLAEFVFIDGQQLAPTSFGAFDSGSGIWKPIDVSGLTFGTNGFYLDFKDSSALGADASSNSNNFTVNNLTSIDQTTDTCTNNFATINPLDNYYAQATLSEGNTKVETNSSAEAMSTSTFAMTKGRWYFEVDNISGSGAQICGITPTPSYQSSSFGKSGDVTPHTISYIQSGKVQEGNGSGGQTDLATYASYTNGDIIGVYLDLEDMKAYLSKNGALQSSTGIDLEPLASNGTGHYMFFVGDNNSGTRICEANFGNGFQSLTSAVTDDNGFGAFEYSPNITGDGTAKSFYACCTKNLNA